MKKKNVFISIFLVMVLFLSSVTGVFAASAASKRNAAANAEKKANAAAEKAEKASKNADAQREEAGNLELKFYELQGKIEKQQAKISKTKTKLKKKQKEVDNQTDDLNDRLTAMYKTGSIGFIDVILNSEGLEDLLANMGMVQNILKSDQKLLTKLETDLKEIDKLKKQQESQEAVLKDDQVEIESTRQQCIAAANQYDSEAQKLKEEEEELRAQAEKLAAEADRLAQQAESSGSFTPTPGGQYAWPTDGNYIFTSYYGWRIHPIFGDRRYHSGYDICLTGGSYGKPVYSAGDGVVTMASSYGGYGNCVQIAIGNGYTTLYGHLSGYAVSAGQTVQKGQVVGYIGSTGWSTGPHLHFSLYRNGSLVDPMVLY